VLKAIGESLCKERAGVRIESKASLNADEASLENDQRLTGTLSIEISDISQFFSLP